MVFDIVSRSETAPKKCQRVGVDVSLPDPLLWVPGVISVSGVQEGESQSAWKTNSDTGTVGTDEGRRTTGAFQTTGGRRPRHSLF